MPNQNPEQLARDAIDRQLAACGWQVQSKKRIDLNAGPGIAVREYSTDVGPADYVLFVDGQPVGVIEAKREDQGHNLSVHEDQAQGYATARLKYLDNRPLTFMYVSTGEVTTFTDFRDPRPRARRLFTFHRPETLRGWLACPLSVRAAVQRLGEVPTTGLRDCQVAAISQLEASFRSNRPRALVQMATGSGKTFTAITAAYRLLKLQDDQRNNVVRRILFLVDTKNLGEQAEQEFHSYLPPNDNHTFTELYGVCRLRSPHIPPDAQVYISTIQRLYAVLKGQELDETAEHNNPSEKGLPREVPPLEYNERLPIEFFDFIIIDECHRSIYNLWMQVLDYFDAFQVGLTATPDARTFAYFQQNLVSEYTHEEAVADGVNVGYDVYLIETKITREGAVLRQGDYVEHRERLSRRRRLALQDEDEAYSAGQLDRDVVNPNQIRTVIRAFREALPRLFPDRYDTYGRFEVPKTLIFAKTDSHADDIIQLVRETFEESNDFCKKITYKAAEDPKSVLARFRNDYLPRVAVTVDMIATGTDVKPLECLLFMRDVRSRNYFEQMKGRGTRVLSLDDLQKVTPTARLAKDHFVIVDAVGITQSLKTDSRPLEARPGVPLRALLEAVAVGARDEPTLTSLASRLTRLDRQLTPAEQQAFTEKSGGLPLRQLVKNLLNAWNPDVLEALEEETRDLLPPEAPPATVEAAVARRLEQHRNEATRPLTGEMAEYIENLRRVHEQKIDLQNPDELLYAGNSADNHDRAAGTVAAFRQWVEAHRNQYQALQLFYAQPYRRRELTLALAKTLLATLRADRPTLAPTAVWQAYQQLENTTAQPGSELAALVALVRRVAGLDAALTPYARTVDRNFQQWVLKRHHGNALKFNAGQMQLLHYIRDQVATSFHFEAADFELGGLGGLGRAAAAFGPDLEPIINELNEVLAA